MDEAVDVGEPDDVLELATVLEPEGEAVVVFELVVVDVSVFEFC